MEYRRYRSLFWPVLLIGIGLVWLLGNLGYIQPVSIGSLLRLWPVLLIVAGLDILFGRRSPLIGSIIGILAVAAIIFLLVAGPRIGLTVSSNLKTDHFQVPASETTSARVTLDLESYSSNIHVLTDSANLVDATVTHHGEMHLSSSGGSRKEVLLANTGSMEWFNFFEIGSIQPWDIGLNGKVPMDLVVDGGSGSVNMDLNGVNLTSLNGNVGSGSVDLRLADAPQHYAVKLDAGSGSLNVRIPCGNGIEISANGGSGSQSYDIPSGCPVRVEVRNHGSGSVDVSGQLTQVERNGNRGEGAWETSGFSKSGKYILIIMQDLGSGSFSVQ